MKIDYEIEEFGENGYEVTLFNDENDLSLTITGDTDTEWQEDIEGDQVRSAHHMAEARNMKHVEMYDADAVAQPSIDLNFLKLARKKLDEIQIELDRAYGNFNPLSGLV